MLVAPRCPSVGEPSPAHHPVHDLAQRPPHRHPQGPHLRHTQEAAMIARDTRTARASMQFSNSFVCCVIDSWTPFIHSFISQTLMNSSLCRAASQSTVMRASGGPGCWHEGISLLSVRLSVCLFIQTPPPPAPSHWMNFNTSQ